MTKPLKISENQGPLSCKQHDDNIDALLDRRNHTNKIPDCEAAFEAADFNNCVSNTQVVQDLNRDVSELEDNYQLLNQSLAPNGDLETSIQAIDSRLNNNVIDINSALLTIATDLELIEEGETSITSIFSVSELNNKKNDSTDPRDLTRFRLDETRVKLDNFIGGFQPVIEDNKDRLDSLLNTNTGTFTLLSNYVNGKVKTEVNKVPGIDNRVTTNKNNIDDILELTGPLAFDGNGNVKLPNFKNLQTNVVDNRTLALENKAKMGDPANLSASTSTLTYDIKANRDAIKVERDRITSVAQTTIPGLITRINTNQTNADTALSRANSLYNNLKPSKKTGTDRTIIVEPGAYKNRYGGASYFAGEEFTLPSAEGFYYVYLNDFLGGNSGFIEATDNIIIESGLLLCTASVNSQGVLTNIYIRSDDPVTGFTRPYAIRKVGGVSRTDYTATNNATLKGLHFFRNFTVPSGILLNIDRDAEIHVTEKVTIKGRIEVKNFVEGGQGNSRIKVNGGFFGQSAGPGPGTYTTTYHWSTFKGGSGGTSGIIGSTEGLEARIPRGGRGGGTVMFKAGGAIEITGTINANGEDGLNGEAYNNKTGGIGGSGGGSGGSIILQSALSITITSTAKLRVNGGKGGNSRQQNNYSVLGGGGGGGGWISLLARSTNVSSSATIELNGGEPGLNGFGNLNVLNPAQGAGIGGAFCGKGGNGSGFTSADRTAGDGILEIINQPANY